MKRIRHFLPSVRAMALLLALWALPAMARADEADAAGTDAAADTTAADTTAARARGGNADSPKAGVSPGDIYLRQVSLDEAAQFISRIGNTSIVVSSSVANKVVSLYLRDINIEGMIKNLSRAAGIWYRFDPQTKVYILMNAQEYQQDIAITRDDYTRTHVLKHHNVVSIANAIVALFGNRVSLVEPTEEENSNSMGSTTRTSSTANRRYYGESSGSRGGGGGTSASSTDTRREITTLSQARLDRTLDADSAQAANIDAAKLMADTSRQGPPINVTYNLLHNLLLLRSSDEGALRAIDELVREMDRPPRQVLLEMKIIEVELGGDFRSVFDIGVGGDNTTTGPQSLGAGSASGLNDEGRFPRNAASFGNFSEEGSTMIWQIVNNRVRMRLQLLENENRVNVLATPMVVASNNQPARLFIGEEQILVTGASGDSTIGTTGAISTWITVETAQRNVGQTLVVLPRINADRTVTLTIDQDNSRIITGGATLPLAMPNGTVYQFPVDTVNTANLQVTAHARDGLTVAVGGMISQRISDQEEKVPFLGDVPLLGTLFKRTVKGNRKSQLILLITPWVLETPEESDALAREKESQARRLNDSDIERGHWRTDGQTGERRRPSLFDDVAPAVDARAIEAIETVPPVPTAPVPVPAPAPAPQSAHPFIEPWSLP
ncbi:MAG: hypothetical protein LBB76_00945 [Azoarcus sp.]|nr:hypothetical protein [Azoarcus sp.]